MSPPHEEFLGSNIIMVDIDSSVQARVRVISRRPSCPAEEGGKEGGAATFLRPSSARSKLELVPCVILETDEKLFAPSLPSKLRTFTTQRRRQRLRWRSEWGCGPQ